MNRINTFKHLPIAVALLLAAAPAFGQSKVQTHGQASGKSSGKLTVESSDPVDGGTDVKAEAIEIRIEDGKVSVKRNGKEVPENQIRRGENGQIIILDENGNELKELGQIFGDSGAQGFFRVGPGDGNMFWTGEGNDGGNMFGVATDDGPAPKVMLGVHMGEPGAALEKHLGLEHGKTTMITGVFEGLPAEQAGLGEYDIIVAVDGDAPADAATIKKALAEKEAGDTVTFRVIQSGTKREIKVKLQGYDADKMRSATLHGTAESNKWPATDIWKGFDWQNMPEFKGQVFVAPGNAEGLRKQLQSLKGLQPQLEQLEPEIQKQVQDALKRYGDMYKSDGGSHNDKDVDAQLDRLDKRMADLEKMLQKLVEKQSKQ